MTDCEEFYRKILIDHNYQLMDFIGKGAYGHVYTVKSNVYNEIFACKILHKDKDSPKCSRVASSFQSEVNALKSLYHPNIVNTYDCFEEENCMFIISEYCSKGNLYDIMQKDPSFITNNLARITGELLNAVKYCHQNSIAHLDIKPLNVFVDEYDRIKLADFGLAVHVNAGEYMSKLCGSVLFMPPEMLKKHVYDPFKADTWSLGVTLYLLATGSVPWANLSCTEAVKFMESYAFIKLPCTFPKCVRDVVARCLTPDPNMRPMLSEVQISFSRGKTLTVETVGKKCKSLPTVISPKVCRTLKSRVGLVTHLSSPCFMKFKM